ncbi:MAG TPA: methylated-DNA--[protein]-cysteine S-methyltransferase [Thermoanaerobaculia bacterium]|jgi:methylated-DNA-[protein]-cysteine S-methyltransferase
MKKAEKRETEKDLLRRKEKDVLRKTKVATPAGAIVLVERGGALVGLIFEDRWKEFSRDLEKRFGEFSFEEDPRGGAPAEALRRYFGGDLGALSEVSVDTGGTPFQQLVWTTLRRIPAGSTWSYARLAREVGRPSATRAVAAANGANPVSIVIPCHRVIGSDGSLTGYGGGLPRKRWLLVHEGALLV